MGWLKTLGMIGGSALGGPAGGAIGGAVGGAVDGNSERQKQLARNRALAQANAYSALTGKSFNMDPVTASWAKSALTGGVQGAMMGNSFAKNGWTMGADAGKDAAAEVAANEAAANTAAAAGEQAVDSGAVKALQGSAANKLGNSWMGMQQPQMISGAGVGNMGSYGSTAADIAQKQNLGFNTWGKPIGMSINPDFYGNMG